MSCPNCPCASCVEERQQYTALRPKRAVGEFKIRNPGEANGPNGYPVDNPAFRREADKIIARRQADADRAKVYRERMREDMRKTDECAYERIAKEYLARGEPMPTSLLLYCGCRKCSSWC